MHMRRCRNRNRRMNLAVVSSDDMVCGRVDLRCSVSRQRLEMGLALWFLNICSMAGHHGLESMSGLQGWMVRLAFIVHRIITNQDDGLSIASWM